MQFHQSNLVRRRGLTEPGNEHSAIDTRGAPISCLAMARFVFLSENLDGTTYENLGKISDGNGIGEF